MKERPMLFNAEMVKAVLSGCKTQTRRVMKPQPYKHKYGSIGMSVWRWLYKKKYEFQEQQNWINACPYGQIGDRLWVRETFRPFQPHQEEGIIRGYQYKADNSFNYIPPLAEDEGCLINRIDNGKWKPSIHMPRFASRINLEVINIRVEQLQDISEKDAESEGVNFLRNIPDADETLTSKELFWCLWDSIYKNWDVNPWVWVVEFKVI